MSQNHIYPDYNFYIPRFIIYPLPVAAASLILSGIGYSLLRPSHPIAANITVGICLLLGLVYLGIFTMLKLITNLERRLHDRDKLLREIPWRGDEHVLDVGVGNGILLLSAAKQLTTGKGIGTDIWVEGSGDNKPDVFLRNAQIESVADKVRLENEDARHLSYADESFDIVISGLTMHHLKAEANKGVREMVRVLKPGGWMAIYDEPSTVFYCTKLMRQNGLHIEKKTTSMVFGKKSVGVQSL
jgi:ubiquinone/menaquinone biosynthesis C-methylase UbiE